ncbi:MAG TPA: ABC-type transport auxiliary lipoprotein family protein, partial [Caulobacteraceae bacterium]|nr:ABC-type transport auxiliary lipoprotein family protein [Caulobacteraceae bacterium]
MRLSRAIVALALGVPLGACALLGGGDPAQLYRFGAEPAPTVSVEGAKFGVLKSTTDFVAAAASDKILTVTQGEAAYIKDARWVSPASVLFDEALDRTFQGSTGRARLITRGEVAKAEYVLKLDVRTFETRYPGPEVVVETRAMLTRNDNRELVAEEVFTSRVQASENRV